MPLVDPTPGKFLSRHMSLVQIYTMADSIYLKLSMQPIGKISVLFSTKTTQVLHPPWYPLSAQLWSQLRRLSLNSASGSLSYMIGLSLA